MTGLSAEILSIKVATTPVWIDVVYLAAAVAFIEVTV